MAIDHKKIIRATNCSLVNKAQKIKEKQLGESLACTGNFIVYGVTHRFQATGLRFSSR